MAMQAGIVKKTKDNSNKKYREHDEWLKGKRLGRPKQRWVLDDAGTFVGHWEKI